MKTLKERLDAEVALRDSSSELSDEKPDPLMIARILRDECHALTCALFAYGNVQEGFIGSTYFVGINMDSKENYQYANWWF